MESQTAKEKGRKRGDTVVVKIDTDIMFNSKRQNNCYYITSTVKQLHQQLGCMYLNRQLPLSYITINMDIRSMKTFTHIHTYLCRQIDRQLQRERERERALIHTGTTQGYGWLGFKPQSPYFQEEHVPRSSFANNRHQSKEHKMIHCVEY